MSDPQQPAEPAPVPPPAPSAAPVPPLAAEPRYPAAPAPGTPVPAAHPSPPPASATPNPYPTAPSAAPTGSPYPPAYPTAAAPGHPAYPQFPSATPTRTDRGSSLGRVAFIVAAVVFVLDLLLILGRPFLYMGDRGYSLIGFVEGAASVVGFLGYAVALVLGIVAARRPGTRLYAGIAIGISAVGLLSIVTVWLASMFYRFL